MTAPSPRPYRNLTDEELAAKRFVFDDWIADPNAYAKMFPAQKLRDIEAEQRHRELERAAKEREVYLDMIKRAEPPPEYPEGV